MSIWRVVGWLKFTVVALLFLLPQSIVLAQATGVSSQINSVAHYNEQVLSVLEQEIQSLSSNAESLSADSGSELIVEMKLKIALASALLRRADHYQTLGHLNRAATDLQQALKIANILQHKGLQSMASGSLGELLHLAENSSSFNGVRSNPAELFEQSLMLAREINLPAFESIAFSRLGDWQLSRAMNKPTPRTNQQAIDKAEELAIALKTHQQAVEKADELDSVLTQANSRVKFAKAARVNGSYELAMSTLIRVKYLSADIENVNAQAEVLLETGRESSLLPIDGASDLATDLFDQVRLSDKSKVDRRVIATAYGERGKIYVAANQVVDAALQIERAVQLAPQAHDIAYSWEWTLGRIYNSDGDHKKAISAYRRAVRHIDQIRQDIPISYSNGRSSFQSDIAPMFLEFADLLMLQSDSIGNEDSSQELLFEAQMILEQLKGAELEDYFRGACVIDQASSINQFPIERTAVIYPVILQQRLAILLNINNIFYHVSVPVSSERLGKSVNELVGLLRDYESDQVQYQQVSQQIYNWIFDPISKKIEDSDVDTLFFVPDGVLRTIPIAALWDGESYLVEKYEIATAPGLTLLASERLSQRNRSTLVAGLSRPGAVVNKLPMDFYQSYLPNREVSVRGGEVQRSVGNDEHVRNELSLPSVKLEVQTLANESKKSTVLFNEDFSLGNFTDEIQNNSHQIVHVASHGYFGGKVEDSFIMTHDELLDLGQLSDLFKPKKYSDQPIDLLILSACQTAVGNDLAPLGLSGVALASGVRSVLGSLWVVADEATQRLMGRFYREVNNPVMSKSGALQAAQIEAISGNEYQHPFFWAPFILVGDWL